MNWDTYFLHLCNTVAKKSPCLSRKIGAILVRDNSILSTGYNGPPRGIPHCGEDRLNKDDQLKKTLKIFRPTEAELTAFKSSCPRKVLGYKSGTYMELCPAQHAEENAVSNAARCGTNIFGSILYMNTTVLPCQKCFGTLINAGVVEIVTLTSKETYDIYTNFLIKNSNIKIRTFNLEE